MRSRHLVATFALVLLTSGCSAGNNGQASGSTAGSGGSGSQTSTSAVTGGATNGATTSTSTGAGTPDGTPTRVQCTSLFGSGLSTTHGRLDGYLVSIVPPGKQGCNGDSGHVHLQVKINGAIYDVAVNTDVLIDEADAALPDGAWSEGWHPGMSLDYVANLGLHSGKFTTTNPTALAQKIESELAQVNHISVFATGYGPTGAHDVHRKSPGVDGAIVINPLSATPHLLVFSFSTQSF